MASTSDPPGTTVQEYSIRVPKNTNKTYKVMRFNASVNVDFTKWSQVKMEREDNIKEFCGNEEDRPKFGAGSEFGREAKEDARRKKYGIVSRKYKPEDQPWLLKVGGKTGKKFKGTREGGVSDNAAYYVFTHAPDGSIEAFPLEEWYNFQPTQRYKALSAEEAELEFGRRNKQFNYFSLMMRKRLRGENEDEVEEGEESKVKGNSKVKKGDLKISEMDDWVDSSESSDSDSEEEVKEDKEKKEKDMKKKKNVNARKKTKKDSDDEAFEESDDGDEEGREVDYISDSSESASDNEMNATNELKGVAEEDALRKLLSSGEDDEEEEEKQNEEKGKEDELEGKAKGDLPDLMNEEKDKTKKPPKEIGKKKKDIGVIKPIKNPESSSELSWNSSDSDNEQNMKKGSKGVKGTSSAGSSRSATSSKDKDTLPGSSVENRREKIAALVQKALMRKEALQQKAAALQQKAIRKKTLDNFATAAFSPITGSGDSGITEDAVRRYLMRKPMTTTELLQKFKTRKTGLTSDQLVNIMTQILKRINPVKETIRGKMYLSIKPGGWKQPHMNFFL